MAADCETFEVETGGGYKTARVQIKKREEHLHKMALLTNKA